MIPDFPHTRLMCTDPECDGNCNTCALYICSVCNCAEGTLLTHCPGVPVNMDSQDAIMSNHVIDFTMRKTLATIKRWSKYER